jgi:hypothetical protein
MWYLASPYSDPSPAVREFRFVSACRAAALLMSQGQNVYSPIAHSHSICVHGGQPLPQDGAFWLWRDMAILKHCERMVILPLPGWAASNGIMEEAAFARRNDIPIVFMEPV